MWEAGDTIGVISCAVGLVTLLIFLILPVSNFITLFVIAIIGGANSLTMGVIAVSKQSKIGIGGIVIGSLLVFMAIVSTFVAA